MKDLNIDNKAKAFSILNETKERQCVGSNEWIPMGLYAYTSFKGFGIINSFKYDDNGEFCGYFQVNINDECYEMKSSIDCSYDEIIYIGNIKDCKPIVITDTPNRRVHKWFDNLEYNKTMKAIVELNKKNKEGCAIRGMHKPQCDIMKRGADGYMFIDEDVELRGMHKPQCDIMKRGADGYMFKDDVKVRGMHKPQCD